MLLELLLLLNEQGRLAALERCVSQQGAGRRARQRKGERVSKNLS